MLENIIQTLLRERSVEETYNIIGPINKRLFRKTICRYISYFIADKDGVDIAQYPDGTIAKITKYPHEKRYDLIVGSRDSIQIKVDTKYAVSSVGLSLVEGAKYFRKKYTKRINNNLYFYSKKKCTVVGELHFLNGIKDVVYKYKGKLYKYDGEKIEDYDGAIPEVFSRGAIGFHNTEQIALNEWFPLKKGGK